MNRRTFLIGTGALAAGSAAAIGTGAFTETSADRGVAVETAADSEALLGLEAGDCGLVRGTESGALTINLDGDGAIGSGVNLDATTTIGDPTNPTDEYAFKVINQGTQDLMFKMNYYFQDTTWIENKGQDQSYLEFLVANGGGSSASRTYPDQRGYNKDYSLGNPEGSGFGDNTGNYKFNVGEEYYVVITVDTSGANASPEDDLSGTAVLQPGTTTTQDNWDPTNPPR